MKFLQSTWLILLLTACSTGSVSSLSSSFVSSSDAMSSFTATSSSSTSPSSSSLVSASTSSATSTVLSSSITPTLNQDWVLAMGNINPINFYGVEETLPANLAAENVTNVHAVYNLDGTLFGYAYEAKVDGNGGPRSNRFRVGLANGMYAGFQSLFNREHLDIGSVIIDALVNELAGVNAEYLLAMGIMLDANATLTGLTASVTLNGMAGALETITAHYLSKIQVE